MQGAGYEWCCVVRGVCYGWCGYTRVADVYDNISSQANPLFVSV